MPDTSLCYSLVRGRVIRVTKLNGCGVPVLGPTSQVVSEGFISVGLTSNIEEGETISIPNAAGKICILDEPAPIFNNYDLEISLCGVNPDLISLLTGQPIVLDQQATPQGVGFRVNSKVDLDASGFAIEMWTGVAGGACEDGEQTYGYFLLPFVKGGVVGDFTIENGAINFTVSGAKSKDGSGWGVGPYDVVRDLSGVPSPLATAITAGDHLNMELTSVPPPDDLCGAGELGVPATSAVAGIPGTYLPANSYGRADFASMTGLTASPLTAWTTGQHVVNRDGSKGYWGGAAWIAGEAP